MTDSPQNNSAAPAPAPHDVTQRLDLLDERRRKRELLAELSKSSGEGDAVSAEEVLARWPADPAKDADAASVLFQDFLQRRGRGEDTSLHEYQQRFPQHSGSLGDLLRRQDVLRSMGAVSGSIPQPLRLPDVGAELFGFRLRGELGRGAFARVYLAEQGDLADRPVVLKVSEATGDEARTLAQLQHTNIVPIYSVHEDAAAGLRAVCMPYFGGASLSQVLLRLRERVEVPTRGRELADALAEVDSRRETFSLPGGERGGVSEPPFASWSYLHASAWVVGRLAEALQHAHDRGVLHRDIKPSNVLLASDGQPLLLDFNLAQDLKEDVGRAGVGGTVAYMAPEHLRALAARDPALARQVDRRSDLYALGMLLYEMLAGKAPFEQSASYTPMPALIKAMAVERGKAAPSLRRRRPDAPWSLESIARKCLAPDPAARYQQAEELAEDLRRFLDDLPLKHAPELSRAERARKWLRRHPRLASSGSVGTFAAVLLIATAGAFLGARGHLAVAREELQAQESLREHDTLAQRALRLVNVGEGAARPAPEKEEVLCEALAVYGVLENEDWQDRPAWRRLGEADRRRAAEDVRELLLLLAWAHTRADQPDPEALRDALGWLGRAAAVRGVPPSQALALDRASYLERLGEAGAAAEARAAAQQTPPASARDHYLLALGHARANAHAEALAVLDRGLGADGRHYWSWWLRGLCHQTLGQHALAVADFSVCLGRSPEAVVHLNRAYSLYQLGELAESARDCGAALALDPNLTAARWNRGVALLELGRLADALEDFRAEPRRDETLAHLHEGVALEGLGRGDEADAAFAQALDRARAAAVEVRHLVLCRYGIAVSRRRPGRAEKAFADVLAADPDDATALYGLGALRAEAREPAKALASFDRALDLRPDFPEARRFRAVLLARQGKSEEAGKDINICLAKQPGAGMTLYAAACVCALSSRGNPDAAGQALALLEKAFARGYGKDRAADDADLDAVKQLPEFRRLVEPRP